MFLLKATKSMECFWHSNFLTGSKGLVYLHCMVDVGESTSPMDPMGLISQFAIAPTLTVGNQVMAEPVSVMNTLPLGRVGCLSTQQLCPMVHGKAGKSLFFVDSWNL